MSCLTASCMARSIGKGTQGQREGAAVKRQRAATHHDNRIPGIEEVRGGCVILDYSLSADEAADVLRQVWNKKIIPLQTGLDATDAKRKEFEEKMVQRISKAFSLKN